MANIFLLSLGCDKNRIDAEIMAKRLQDAGHRLCDDVFTSDVALVNTCGFIEAAKKEAIDAIFEMVRIKEDEASPIRAVVVTGCLAERYRDEVADQIPETDAVIGIAKNHEIVAVIEEVLRGERVTEFDDPDKLIIEGERLVSTPPHYAYLKIAEGCSNHCTYCAIPSIRGRFRSRRMEDIVGEAKTLVKDGAKELILIAQDTTAYGRDLDDGSSLAALLRELVKIDGIWKIRILYAYPDFLTDELIDVIASEPKIAHYLDIPFQHADKSVLRRMGRFGDKETLLALVERIRAKVPDISLRSSFIVGFPGETIDHFDALLEFLKKAKLDRAGCFLFSPEEGTPAAKLDGQMDEDVKELRAESFMALQTRILEEKQKEKIGRTLEAIVEGFDEESGMYVSRTEYDAPEIDTVLYIDTKKKLIAGDIADVRITDADSYDLFGTLENLN